MNFINKHQFLTAIIALSTAMMARAEEKPLLANGAEQQLLPLTIYTPAGAPPTPAIETLPLKQSISQYDITWTFQEPVRVGQFINGDWYVVGPVTVVQIDPSPRYGKDVADEEVDASGGDSKTPVEKRSRNGSMLNMPPKAEIAWDSGVKEFYKPGLRARLPIAMQPGDSLVSTISHKKEDVEISNGRSVNRRTFHDNCPTRVGAVLTCVKAPQPADAFRPGYCDRSQQIYLARNLNRALLPKLPAIAGAPSPLTLAKSFQKPWLNTGFFGFDEPMENMPHYGQQVCATVSAAGLVLCFDLPAEEKERLLVNFVQVGIDYYGMIRSGHPGWPCWGGHGSGRKFPIVFAGVLLGDEKMANVTRYFPKAQFGEDEQTAYGDCWSGAKVVFTGHSGIDAATGIGRDFGRGKLWGPYEHLAPEKWNHDNFQSEAYRRANTSCAWTGEALVMRIMKLEKQWNHDAFFDYVDRWMNENDAPLRAEEAKFAPEDMGKAALSDPSKTYCQESYTDPRWVQPLWAKLRSTSAAPADGWTKPHDDGYYRNAIAKQKPQPTN